ncbi:MAG: hypothetical protein SOR38_07435 [Oscillospiraceae bacterium]|nr:hypothetical protein [Oscillospiraceae bacterium]MDY3065624.1 hypothetical protein [Oscillospiraceae bacterium]
MKKKRKVWIAVAAALAAIVGAAVAVAAFFKKKAKAIGDQLDYDASVYYDDEDGLAESEETVQTEENEAVSEEKEKEHTAQ